MTVGITYKTTAVGYPPDYIHSLNLTYKTAATIDIGPGCCRSDDGTEDMLLTAATTIDITTSGAGGLDTGSEANSTWYYVWLIKNVDTGTMAGLLSISSTGPTMPSGYTARRRVGTVRNDGSSDFLAFEQSGDSADRWYQYDESRNTTLRVQSAGTATAWTDTTTSSATLVPPTATLYNIGIVVGSGVSPNTDVRPKGWTSGFRRCSPNENIDYWVQPGTDQKTQYQNTGASGDAYISIFGYTESL